MPKAQEKPKKEGTKKGIDEENISTKNLEIIRQILEETENNIEKIKHMLFTSDYGKKTSILNSYETKDGKIIEGIFDGQEMIAKDGKKYPVPPNYSSKSKLVSGDMLKLTILNDGSFIFKQIGPVERKKIIGEMKETSGRYFIENEGKKYNVLLASITYFKIKPGTKVTAIIPKERETDWAAIENIIENNK